MLLTLLSLALAESGADTDTSAPEDTSVYVDSNAKAELVYTQESGCNSSTGLASTFGVATLGLLIFPATRRKTP